MNKKEVLSKSHQQLILFIMPTILIIMSFYYGNITKIIHGMLWNNRLISDSFEIMGIGATLLNAGIVGLASAIIIKLLDMKPTGVIFAGTMLMMGFSFLGKNIVNVIPIFIGGFLYAKYQKVTFKSVVITTMLTTTIAPIVSSLVHIHANLLVGIIISVTVGIAIGFFLPAISSQVVVAHHGYSLYNVGFSAGLVGMVLYGILKSIGIEFTTHTFIYRNFPIGVWIMFLIIFIIYIVIGIIGHVNVKQFIQLQKSSGKLVSDFTRMFGFSTSLINIGILGIVGLGIAFYFKTLNGAVISGLLSVVAFGGFGKHLRNTIPIQIGVGIAAMFLAKNIDISLILMTLFLATSLAPVAGEFGIGWGILTGILHMFLVWNFASLHGGISLYNNGLSAGILAMVLIPCIQLLKGEIE